jgi:serine/threonine-protein kinase
MRMGTSMRRNRGDSGSGGSPIGSARDWLAQKKTEGRSRLVLIAVGVALGGYGLGWLLATQGLFPAPPPPGDMYEVPDLYGSDVPSATRLVEETGLALGMVDAFRHPTADSGRIIGQHPLPGQLALPGDSVRVSVSIGVQQRPVPDVSDLRGDRAKSALENAGFDVVLDSVQDDQPRGAVVSIDPEPGSRLSVPGEVRLVLSVGPPQVPMPTLLGMEEAAARDTLTALGLVISRVDEISSSGSESNRVITQEPQAGQLVPRGSEVRFTVIRRISRPDTIPPP